MLKKGKTVLVTGATSGIGYEFAKLFAKEGYDLVHVARNEEKMIHIASELETLYNIKVYNIVKDLSLDGAAKEAYEEVKRQNIQVDILVNNAGAGIFGKFAENDLEKELGTIHLNVLSLVVFTKLFLKEMVERNEGKILQLASMVSTIPAPLEAVYAGTKAFIYIFTESLAHELKGSNVTVTALRPGATHTQFFASAGAKDPENLADPAQVAKDGYEALMQGKTSVISGFGNKVMAHMADVLPDEFLANQMGKQNEKNR